MTPYGTARRDLLTCKFGCCWSVKGNPHPRSHAKVSMSALHRRHKRRGRAEGKKAIAEAING